jgi:hypothetical protein
VVSPVGVSRTPARKRRVQVEYPVYRVLYVEMTGRLLGCANLDCASNLRYSVAADLSEDIPVTTSASQGRESSDNNSIDR